MAKNVAIGIQNFGDLIQKNYFYIDKTDYAFTMKQKLSDSQKSANYPYQTFNCPF